MGDVEHGWRNNYGLLSYVPEPTVNTASVHRKNGVSRFRDLNGPRTQAALLSSPMGLFVTAAPGLRGVARYIGSTS
ncbi:hypothetical protein MRX96_056140 [Rhipicephalus microplus]